MLRWIYYKLESHITLSHYCNWGYFVAKTKNKKIKVKQQQHRTKECELKTIQCAQYLWMHNEEQFYDHSMTLFIDYHKKNI
jgi:hypothetical protein